MFKGKGSAPFFVITVLLVLLLTLSSLSVLPFVFPTWDDAYEIITGEPMVEAPVAAPAEIPRQIQQENPPPKILDGAQMSVYVIDVGQGSATLITTGDHSILIDAGENGKGGDVLDVLATLGIERLDYMIGTHPHSDHIGGMDEVLREIPVDTVILPLIPDKIVPTTKTYEDVLSLLSEKGVKTVVAAPGKSYAVGAMKLDIFGPVGEFDDLNDMSVVSKITFGGTRVLVSGDAEKKAEKAVLAEGYNLASDIYIVGHHGSTTSSSADFLDAINPLYAAISCGLDNDYGHPHAETLQALDDRGVTVHRTDLNGTIVYTTDGANITVESENGELV
ncbi:MAG: ComEC/Rec2 family competence protein [Acetanaerobacterium sp.]